MGKDTGFCVTRLVFYSSPFTDLLFVCGSNIISLYYIFLGGKMYIEILSFFIQRNVETGKKKKRTSPVT